MNKIFFMAFIAASAVIVIYLLFFKKPFFNAKGGFLTNINGKGVVQEVYNDRCLFHRQ